MFDIIYSILVHESTECVDDLVQNIKAFHSAVRVGIILHTNLELFEQVKYLSDDHHVWVHPHPFDKKWCSYTLFLGHIENFLFLQKNNIDARWFCLLASNCMFHRPVTLDLIESKYNESDEVYIPTAPMPPIPEWGPTYQLSCNREFFSFFHLNKIPLINSYHEGTLYPWWVIQMISNFRDWMSMKSIVALDFSFEEVLFPSLHYYFTGRRVRSLCTMKFIEIETLHEIQNPCIKTVPRQYNHPIRVYLRKETEKYKN